MVEAGEVPDVAVTVFPVVVSAVVPVVSDSAGTGFVVTVTSAVDAYVTVWVIACWVVSGTVE